MISRRMRRSVAVGSLFALCSATLSGAPGSPTVPSPPTKDATELGVPFDRYTTKDGLGRTITFYLSKAKTGKPLPLILFLGGSGCQSNFMKQEGRIGGGLQMIWLKLVRGQARVMVVEKPGVKFLDFPSHPGSAEGCSPEFLQEHTLSRWAEAAGASLRAARSLPEIARASVLVVGHSEGGIVAARVAAENPFVTHVASLAGGGPTQLFDLAELARSDRQFGAPNLSPEDRVNAIYAEWRNIQADPDSTAKFWLGHPYRRWASFLASSPGDELRRSRARVYLAHGTKDNAVPIVSFDVLRAEMAARGRDVTAERMDGVDHGFYRDNERNGPPQGFETVFTHIRDWFLPSGS